MDYIFILIYHAVYKSSRCCWLNTDQVPGSISRCCPKWICGSPQGAALRILMCHIRRARVYPPSRAQARRAGLPLAGWAALRRFVCIPRRARVYPLPKSKGMSHHECAATRKGLPYDDRCSFSVGQGFTPCRTATHKPGNPQGAPLRRLMCHMRRARARPPRKRERCGQACPLPQNANPPPTP